MIEEADLNELARIAAPHGMLSLALDVDGRDHPLRHDWETRLQTLLRTARQLAAASGDPVLVDSIGADADRILRSAAEDIDRSVTRGVVWYSDSQADLFRCYRFPVAVRDQVRVAATPFLLPLEAAREASRRWIVALADRQRARLFALTGDHLEELEDFFEPVPPRVESGGWAAARGQRHSDVVAHRHLEHTAEAVRRHLDAAAAAGLLIAGPERARLDLQSLLAVERRHHPVGRASVRVTAGLDEIRDAARRAAAAVSPHLAVLERIRRSTGPEGRGFVGLAAALAALGDGSVDTLLVSRTASAPGARCTACGRLSEPATTCARCGGAAVAVDDVVEAAIDEALAIDAHVHLIEPHHLAQPDGIAGLARHVARHAQPT
jgi:peptide subunit release factor 1 (eRF1)